jgi:hypothetical protein
MKRLFLIFLLLLLTVPVWGATYYIAEGGSAANKEAATSCTSAMSVTVHNSETFTAGDIIYLCDNGGYISAQIQPPSDGVEYHVMAGDNVYIYPSYNFAIGWSDEGGGVWSHDATGVAVIDAFYCPDGPTSYTTASALTEETGTPTAPGSGEWGLSSNVFYVNTGAGDPSGLIQASTGEYAFYITGRDDITIDGDNRLQFGYTGYTSTLGGIAATGGDNVIIKNIQGYWAQHGVTLYNGQSNSEVHDSTFTDCLSGGIIIAQTAAGTNQSCAIRRCTVTRCGTEGGGNYAVAVHGAELGGTDGEVHDVIVENCTISKGNGTGYGNGLQSFTHVYDSIFQNNTISGYSENARAGIRLAGDAGASTGNIVRYNSVTDCYIGIRFIRAAGDIYYNKIYDIGYNWVRVEGGVVTVNNNTMHNSSSLIVGVRVTESGGVNGEVTKATNNILDYAAYGFRTYDAGSSVSNIYNNCFYDIFSDRYYYENGVNQAIDSSNIDADPGYVNESGNDYRITITSPCIDIGLNSLWLGAPNITDYAGKTITDSNGNIATRK